LQTKISKNVKLAKSPIIKFVPLFIKEQIMSAVYLRVGESGVTAAISNLGKVNLPESMAKHVDYFAVNTVAGYLNPKACGVVAFEDKLCVSFASTIDDNELERIFFTFFTEKGIDVLIDTNI